MELFYKKKEKLREDMIVILTQVKDCCKKKEKIFVMSACLGQEVTGLSYITGYSG